MPPRIPHSSFRQLLQETCVSVSAQKSPSAPHLMLQCLFVPATQAGLVMGANLLLTLAGLAAPTPGKGGVPALYPTQAEAEKAARLFFHCKGAHRMGAQWMPCANHGDAQGSAHTH